MRWLYRSGTAAYHLGIRVAARLGNRKATDWVAGRRDYTAFNRRLEAIHREGRSVVWLHAASLGEFEQARPVLALLRAERPDLAVVVSFYSPSGYARCRDTELADAVSYLPPDGPRRAAEWVANLRPRLALFVKYEFWWDHLAALTAAGVPTLLLAGSFRARQPFFSWYGGWWRRQLRHFAHFAVQTPGDAVRLADIGYANTTVTGDPRMDRVLDLAATPFSDPILEAFVGGSETICIAGSVWPADVERIAAAWPEVKGQWKLILAPHELHPEELDRWQKEFSADRYSQPLTGKRVLLLDTIGILSRSYRYGTVAYVGGGFGSGLHNTLEPLSYGLPVCLGPRYHKFPEASETVAAGGAFVVRTGDELADLLKRLADPGSRSIAGKAQRAYAGRQAGAAARTLEVIRSFLPLLLCLLLSGGLGAQSWSTATRLEKCLDGLYVKANLMVALSGTEWRPGLCLGVSRLREEESTAIRLRLEADRTYVFIASGERSEGDLDLYLRTPTGEVLAEDAEIDGTPIVRYTTDTARTVLLQLQSLSGGAGGDFVGFAILRSDGQALIRPRYRAVVRQFGAAAGAVRAAGAATDFTTGAHGWALLGYLLGEEATTLEALYLPPGDNFIAVSAGEDILDIDLFLADDRLELLRADAGEDPYPMLEYRVSEPGPFRLRLAIERARRRDLVLLGFFTH